MRLLQEQRRVEYEHNACIYMAIPGDGASCAPSSAGCREYRGNTGANKRTVSFSDFENGQMDSWTATGTPASMLNPSTEALFAGGHSLSVAGANHHIAKQIGGYNVFKGKSYVLSFTARASTTANITLSRIVQFRRQPPCSIFPAPALA